MNSLSRTAAFALAAAALLPSCQRRHETVKSDLSEAGYQLTTADWFRASRSNDVAALRKFNAAKFPTDSRDSSGDSALHAAATGGAQKSADYLLSHGLKVDALGAMDRTPLMAAVLADQTETVRWLLRQGANPTLKDKEGFCPLMLAVREGKPGSVTELAPYDRENLDPALLLASLNGRADVIDALTNYGASVYTQMDDGRTPLMVAAENGHLEAVKILLELGAGRFTKDPEGQTAADLATAAGHPEITDLINQEPLPADFALDSPQEIANAMDTASAPETAASPKRPSAISLEGETLSAATASTEKFPQSSSRSLPTPPLIMRHYREKEVPIRFSSVQGDTATLSLAGPRLREIKVRNGETIPGSNLVIVSMRRHIEDSKVSAESPTELEDSIIEVRDSSTGSTRKWRTGFPAKAHDPVALVEDASTGKRYTATAGQHFKGADGTDYVVSEVRPNQLIIQDIAKGTSQTLPLRGPRG